MSWLVHPAEFAGQIIRGVNIPMVELSSSSIQGALGFMFALAGIIALIFVLIGAVKFTASGGDPQKIASGRNTVLYALIGLVVALFSATIVSIVGQEAGEAATAVDNPLFGLNGILTSAVRWLSFVVGAASVIGIIYGGLRYVTSAGDPKSAEVGRNTIIYSLVGVMIAFAARFLVAFVLERLG